MAPYFVKVFELYPPKSAWGGYVCYGEGKGTSGGGGRDVIPCLCKEPDGRQRRG